MDDSVVPHTRAGPEPVDVDRLEALEQQVRQLTSRLAGWVEAQLVRAMEDRHNDLKAVRSELQAMEERLARARAEAASSTPAATTPAGASSTEAMEQRVRQAMSRLTDSVETRLAEAAAARRSEAEALQRELEARFDERLLDAGSRSSSGMAVVQDRLAQQTAALAERLEEVARQAGATAIGVSAVTSEMASATSRTDAFEQRVKSAMGRLTDLVETRLAESSATLQGELDRFRVELGERRLTELDSAKGALEGSFGDQLRDARTQIGTAVDAAHKRLMLLQEQLDARVDQVAGHATSAVASVEALATSAASAEARLDGLEVQARRTDAKLRELVEERFAGLAAERTDELARFRAGLEEAMAAQLGRVRAEVSSALGDTSKALAAGASQLGRNRAELQAALAARVEGARAELAEMLDAARKELAAGTAQLDVRHASLAVQSAEVVAGFEAQAKLASTVAALSRIAERTDEHARKSVEELAARLDELANAMARTASIESGTLAPLRSDMYALQAQVAELADAVAELPSKRKPAAARAKISAAEKARAIAERKAARGPRPGQ